MGKALISNVRTFLLQDSDISDAFGERIFVSRASDLNSLPSPVGLLHLVSEDPFHTQQGRGDFFSIIQIDTLADTREDCYSYADLIRERLDSHSGVLSEVVVGMCFASLRTDDWEKDSRRFRVIDRFQIGWKD